MHEFLIRAIEQGGYIGIFLLMALENIFPPIPSEVIMGLGGMAVARGSMDFWPLMIAGTLGSTLGNYAWFWLGDHLGYRRLAPFIERKGRWLTLEWEDVERASRFFRKHGPWVVFFLRFTPFLRTMISLPAGLAHMGTKRFLVFTTAGVFIWNLLLVEGGRRLAVWLEQSQHILGWIILGVVALVLLAYIYRVFTWTPRAMREGRCNICGRKLEQSGDTLSREIDGDCWGCMGELELGEGKMAAQVRAEIAAGLRKPDATPVDR